MEYRYCVHGHDIGRGRHVAKGWEEARDGDLVQIPFYADNGFGVFFRVDFSSNRLVETEFIMDEDDSLIIVGTWRREVKQEALEESRSEDRGVWGMIGVTEEELKITNDDLEHIHAIEKLLGYKLSDEMINCIAHAIRLQSRAWAT